MRVSINISFTTNFCVFFYCLVLIIHTVLYINIINIVLICVMDETFIFRLMRILLLDHPVHGDLFEIEILREKQIRHKE